MADGQVFNDEEPSGRASAVTCIFKSRIEEKFQQDRCFMVNELNSFFTEISQTVRFEIDSDDLGFIKQCAMWVICILMDIQKK